MLRPSGDGSSWEVEQPPQKERTHIRHGKMIDVFILIELICEKKGNHRSGVHSEFLPQMDACFSGMKILASMKPPLAMQEMRDR